MIYKKSEFSVHQKQAKRSLKDSISLRIYCEEKILNPMKCWPKGKLGANKQETRMNAGSLRKGPLYKYCCTGCIQVMKW